MDPDFIRCWRDADDANNTRVYYNITNDQWNCAEHYGTCDSCPRLEADPDIAGIGVIAAFLVSASLTALLGILFSLVTPVNHSGRTETNNYRNLDNVLASFLNEPIVRLIGEKHTGKISQVIYDMIICLGDQQPVVGIALLVATLKKLYVDKSLSVFHLQLLVNLVFGSATAFGYTIISWRLMRERGFYGSNTPPENHTKFRKKDSSRSFWWHLRERLPIAIRAFLIFTFYFLAGYTGCITAITDGLDMNCPALCHAPVAKLSEYNWVTETRMYYPVFGIVAQTQVYAFLTSGGSIPDSHRSHAKVPYKILACYVWIKRQMCAACLSLAVISFYFVVFLSNTWNIWAGRTRSRFAEDIKDEMSMGFGQIVPLFLLIQPLLQLLDSIKEHYRENKKKPEEEAASENVTVSTEG